jgi:peptidoglycan-associated lipoprotein
MEMELMGTLPTGRLTLCVLAAAAPLMLGACKKKMTPAVTGPTPTQPAANGPTSGGGTNDRDAADRAAREAAERERRLTAARNTLLETVYFEYDQAGLTDQGRAALESKLAILQANPGLRLRVAGHCDERGSDEYNLALGQRRAASVQRFFADRGVDGSRFEIVSFGRERPAVIGGAEDSWARNRRAEFEIVAGGESLKAP